VNEEKPKWVQEAPRIQTRNLYNAMILGRCRGLAFALGRGSVKTQRGDRIRGIAGRAKT